MQDVGTMIEIASKVNILQACHDGLVNSHEAYIKAQRQQMFNGLRSDGKPIYRLSTGSDTYSPAYAKKKGKLKPIDLYDKGDFYNEQYLVENGNDPSSVIVDSADSKSGKLQEDYGGAIFGLNNESAADVIPTLQQAATAALLEQLSKRK